MTGPNENPLVSQRLDHLATRLRFLAQDMAQRSIDTGSEAFTVRELKELHAIDDEIDCLLVEPKHVVAEVN